jgi:hypothetical protein
MQKGVLQEVLAEMGMTEKQIQKMEKALSNSQWGRR